MAFGLGKSGRKVDNTNQDLDPSSSPDEKAYYDPEAQDDKGRKMSRIAAPGSLTGETDKLDVGRQMELEATNSIKYRTCSWPKTAALLFSEYICLAIMSFPYSYSVLGLVPGLILTVVVALSVLYTSLIIWYVHPRKRMGDFKLISRQGNSACVTPKSVTSATWAKCFTGIGPGSGTSRPSCSYSTTP